MPDALGVPVPEGDIAMGRRRLDAWRIGQVRCQHCERWGSKEQALSVFLGGDFPIFSICIPCIERQEIVIKPGPRGIEIFNRAVHVHGLVGP